MGSWCQEGRDWDTRIRVAATGGTAELGDFSAEGAGRIMFPGNTAVLFREHHKERKGLEPVWRCDGLEGSMDGKG